MAKNNNLLGVGLIPWLTSGTKFGKGASDFLLGTPDKLKKIPTGTQEQLGLHNNLLQQAMGMSQAGGGYNQAQQ